MNDIERNEAMVRMIGSLVYNKQLRVERKGASSDFSEIHIILGSNDSIDMYPLREFIKLGYELRSVRNEFQVEDGYEGSTSVEGGTVMVFIKSPSNQKVET